MDENKIITFIGAGNMARSLITGLCEDGYPSENIWATNPSRPKLDQLQQGVGIHVTQDNQEGARQADVIVLCVKPNVIPEVLNEIKAIWEQQQPLVISVAAGFRESSIRGSLGPKAAIVRCMPNMPSLVRSGATGLFANENTTEDQREIAESILRSVSIIQWLPQEADLDKLTALSGSGPGYLFHFMDAMADKAVALGLDPEQVRLFTAQTFLGAARIALDTDQSFSELCGAVCSKGGTTERAIQVFEKQDVKNIIAEAMQACYERAQEIGETLSS